MTHNIKSIRGRAALVSRKRPYWASVAPGIQLGVYVGKRASSWVVRVDNPGQGPRQIEQKLGPVEPDTDGMDFVTAQQTAIELGRDIRAAAMDERVHSGATITVADACDTWLAAKVQESSKRASGHTMANWHSTADRIKQWFGPATTLDSITGQRVMDFASRPLERTRNGCDVRAADGINREIAACLGIFNHRAKQSDYKGRTRWSDAAKISTTEVQLQHADADDGFDAIAMTLADVRCLIAALDDPAVVNFVQAMFLTCQRVQSLRMADVKDFDKVGRRLRLRYGKNSRKRKGPLMIPLFGAAYDLFDRLSQGRPKDAPLLPSSDGGRLPQDFARYPIARAVKAAGLPDGVTLYKVRHAALTHFLTVEKADPLTISLMGDVSPEIIRDRYLKRSVALPDGPDLMGAGVTPLKVVKG